MFLAWIRMWRDMFKFFPPNSIGRKDFALTMAMNLIMVGVFMAFCLGFYEDFIIMLGNFFFVALTSLLVRRLRDAGFSFVFGLLPYGWILFWWGMSFGDISYDDRTTIALVGAFGFVPIFFLTMLLCAFPTRGRRIVSATEVITYVKQSSEIGFLQTWINLWKNIFKFYPPYRTGRREFAFSVIEGIIFYFFIMSFMMFIQNLVFGVLVAFVFLAFLVAYLSLIARRLRDAGFSAWFVFPVIVVLCCEALAMWIENPEMVFFYGAVFFYFYPFVLLIMCVFPSKNAKSEYSESDYLAKDKND